MIIKKYEYITPRRFLDCRIKALQEILRSIDISVSSNDVMVLAESVVFQYGTVDFPLAGIYDLPYCVSSESDIEKTIFRTLGINWIEENIGNSQEEWSHMKELLDRGIPILFKIDARFLNFKEPDKQQMIDIHYLSSMLLVGYKEDMSAVYVVLTNEDSVSEPKELPFEDFEKYRNTKCIPFSPKNRCMYILPSENQNIFFSLEEKLWQSYKQTCCKFRKSEPVPVNIDGFECQKLYEGFYGLKMLKKHIDSLCKMTKMKNSDTMNKYVCVSLLFFKKNMMFGTYSAFRQEFAQCLKEHSSILDTPSLIKASKYFEKSAEEWKRVFISASKAAHDFKHISLYLGHISVCLGKIQNYEKWGIMYIERGALLYDKKDSNRMV